MIQTTDIMGKLQDMEVTILLGINHAHNEVLDKVMWLISDRWFWIPLYMVLIFWVFRKHGPTKGSIVVLLIGLLIFLTDQTCAHVIRPWIGRLRPTCIDNPISEFVRVVNDYRGGRYGFPSCHAANTFALAVFLSLCMKNRIFTISIFLWSLLVSYSRLYLGIHYPGDIIAGWMIGSIYALIVYQLYRMIIKYLKTTSNKPSSGRRHPHGA